MAGSTTSPMGRSGSTTRTKTSSGRRSGRRSSGVLQKPTAKPARICGTPSSASAPDASATIATMELTFVDIGAEVFEAGIGEHGDDAGTAPEPFGELQRGHGIPARPGPADAPLLASHAPR